MDLSDTDDGALQRVYIAARDGLQPVHQLRRDNNRIDRQMRHRRVCAAAIDRDLENVECDHHRSWPDRELADRHLRPIVHAIDRFDRIALQHSFLDHQPGAALILLGRLKDEMDCAGEIAGLCEVLRRAEEHRGMTVVTAGVHTSAMA